METTELDRRAFLKGVGAIGAGGVLADLGLFEQAASAQQGNRSTKPNIVFIMVDEMAFPTVFPRGVSSPAGYLRKFMPNTYELWSHGVRFERFYGASSACSPSRATMVTGLYSHQHWLLLTRGKPMPQLQPQFPTYGRLLRRLGYQTPYFGKWHLSNEPKEKAAAKTWLESYGFDGRTLPDVHGENGEGQKADPDTADQAVAWLSRRRKNEAPWCATVSLINPHDRTYWWGGAQGDRYNQLFEGTGLRPLKKYETVSGQDDPPRLGYPTLPPNWESRAQLQANKPTTQTVYRQMINASFGAGISDDPLQTGFSVQPYEPLPNVIGVGIGPHGYWERGMDAYSYVENLVDAQIGRVVASVPRDVLKDTVFVLVSDHGEFNGAHGLTGKVGTLYDEAFHVPMIVADPGRHFIRRPDTSRTQLASMVDLMPMLVTMGNRGSTSWMRGDLRQLYGDRLDLVDLLRNPRARGRDHVLFATDDLMPDLLNFLGAPIHALGVRTKKEKLGTYTHWRERTTQPRPRGMQLEYYDYSERRGRLELDNMPDDRRAKALLRRLREEFVPRELERPLPRRLRPAQKRAKAQYIAFTALVNRLGTRELVEEGQWHRDFEMGSGF